MCVERRDCPIECLAGEPRIYNVAIDIKQSRREATGRCIGSFPGLCSFQLGREFRKMHVVSFNESLLKCVPLVPSNVISIV